MSQQPVAKLELLFWLCFQAAFLIVLLSLVYVYREVLFGC